jgi:hypothetical protein
MRKLQGATCSTLGLVSALAVVIAGCSVAPSEADEIGVCIDPKTEQRIDDDKCSDGSNGWESDDGSVWFWYSVSSGHSAPPIGQKVNPSHGYRGEPKSTYYSRGGVPKTGSVISKSTIQRGGFGVGNAGRGSSGG